MLFRIVYLWQGQRHWGPKDYSQRDDAQVDLRKFHADGWQAWIEQVR